MMLTTSRLGWASPPSAVIAGSAAMRRSRSFPRSFQGQASVPAAPGLPRRERLAMTASLLVRNRTGGPA